MCANGHVVTYLDLIVQFDPILDQPYHRWRPDQWWYSRRSPHHRRFARCPPAAPSPSLPAFLRKTEAVGADHRAGMQNAALAQSHPGVQVHPRAQDRVGAQTARRAARCTRGRSSTRSPMSASSSITPTGRCSPRTQSAHCCATTALGWIPGRPLRGRMDERGDTRVGEIGIRIDQCSDRAVGRILGVHDDGSRARGLPVVCGSASWRRSSSRRLPPATAWRRCGP